MQSANPPAARQHNMENYNGLAAFPNADSAPQGHHAYGYAPTTGQHPHLPTPMQSATSNGTVSSTQQQSSAPAPPSISLVEGNRKFTLVVVQQPKRARMCGFGDKDRRPITPPPCIRLVVTDVRTGIEIDLNDIDHSMFVLNVDLWNDRGDREVNLVRHSATSPSISATIPVSYSEQNLLSAYHDPFISGHVPAYAVPPPHYGQAPSYGQPYGAPPYPPQQLHSYGGPQPPGGPYASQQQSQAQPQYHQYGPGTPGYPPPQSYQHDPNAPQASYYGHQQSHYGSNGSRPSFSAPGPMPQGDLSLARLPVSSTAPTGMFTRNLIGSLAASAFRLTDPGDRMGIWFVLQDLSVRTEGCFRLRLSFVNVGPPSVTPNGNPSNQNSILNTGRAPVLAACFSDVFTVYSAKKFPGVVESTPLSKCFATQGIKIPIRKDGGGNPTGGAAGGRRAGDEGEYDE